MANTYEVERSLGGTYSCEAGGEYTLPDYMPEVRRILRVDCDAAMTGQYDRQDKTEIGGEVRYYLIYLDGEGTLASASFDGTFDCSVPGGEGVRMQVNPTVENVSCRLGGPRRVSMKANIGLRPIAVASEPYTEPEMPEAAGQIEALRRSMLVGETLMLESGELDLTESVKAEPDSRLLSTEGKVLIREARPEAGGVRVRGDLWLSALCADGEGKPYAVKGKIPIEELLNDENVTPAFSAVAWGRCPSLTATPASGEGESSLVFDARVVLSCLAVTNETVTPMCDLYATACPVEVIKRPLTGRYYPACLQGNYTVDGNAALSEIGLGEDTAPVDCRGSATVSAGGVNGNEITLEGDVRVQGLFSQGGDEPYAGASFSFPYKVRMSGKEPIPEGANLLWNVQCVGCHVRCDGQRVTADAELALTCLATVTDTVEVVSGVTADPENPYEKHAGEIVAAYLKNGDSLWSIGRRYHVPLSELVEANALPDAVMENPDAPYHLDGYSHLMLEY